ncbi:hypothetical protein [Nocardioides marmotae]|uniref:hypothetical protein n=1 Tax=Nocardioides marmotae TaxID=2663857 RepID=UPI0012B57F58|nr:hypothetical protein [Nocardioides marmotae]MBC9732283.1 hypothetical protein [Nocardioides marmotae]MTB83404.1 hypothetical protein [Nocardioides marmotae]
MLTISVVMLLILLVAGLVVTFVAFPHRGHQVPQAPWLGDAMTRLADRAPVLHHEAEDRPAHHPH